MAAYEYLAFDLKGSRKKGLIEADTAKQARQQLRGMGLSPVELEVVSQQQDSKPGKTRRDKISVATLSLITRQLSTLISAGQPIESALHAVSNRQRYLFAAFAVYPLTRTRRLCLIRGVA